MKISKTLLAISITTALTVSELSYAEWAGDAELGLSMSGGNTENTTANAKLDMDTAKASWRHNIFADAYYAEDDSEKTAERYAVGYKPRHFMTERDYLFAILRYDQDKFAFIDRRTTEVVGYGRQLIATKKHYLDGEIGLGARQSDYIENSSTDNLDENELIYFLGGKYTGRISKTARFSETVRVEIGEDNNYIESITGLSLSVTGSISAKISYTLRHNSDVKGTKGDKTDTLTGVNLIYSF